MTLPTHLQRFNDTPIKVLDDGHVQLIDVLGDDMSVVNAARVSYGAGTKRVSEDRHLIRYLMRHAHTSPFEMCEIVLRIRIPMDAWRQMVRHRTASINEYSTRYSEAIDACQQTDPAAWRLQAKDNKQGSSGVITEWPEGANVRWMVPEGPTLYQVLEGETTQTSTYTEKLVSGTPGDYLTAEEQKLQELARHVYEERLELGIAREQARKDLPLSTYTEAYWKCDLHNLLHFLALRMDGHAQQEIREYANAIAQIVKEWVPWTWEAFQDYRLGAMKLTRLELECLGTALQQTLKQEPVDPELLAAFPTQESPADSFIDLACKGLKGREKEEFKTKLQKILST